MNRETVVRGLMMGVTFAMWLASAEVGAASPVKDSVESKSAVKNDSSTLIKDEAFPAEARSKREKYAHIRKAVQAVSDSMNGDFIMAARNRDKKRRDKEKTEKSQIDSPADSSRQKKAAADPS